jgi:outer membrane immunogenic protein
LLGSELLHSGDSIHPESHNVSAYFNTKPEEYRMMKFLVAAAGLVVLGAPALAADMAPRTYTKTPMMAPPVYNWSGFYVGINGGGGSSRDCWNLVAAPGVVVAGTPAEGCHDATGGTVGGQIGYRWQSTNWVFGLEAQGNWANFKGSNTNLFFSATSDQSRMDAFGLFTG